MTTVRRVGLTELDPQETLALLQRKTSAVMAFVDKNGYPRMVPCWFLWHEDAFYTTSIADKFHVRAIRNNPRGSFCIEIEDVSPTMRSNRQVKGVGEFEIIEDNVDEWGARIRERYLGPAKAGTVPFAADRVVLRMKPTKITAHGGDLILE